MLLRGGVWKLNTRVRVGVVGAPEADELTEAALDGRAVEVASGVDMPDARVGEAGRANGESSSSASSRESIEEKVRFACSGKVRNGPNRERSSHLEQRHFHTG